MSDQPDYPNHQHRTYSRNEKNERILRQMRELGRPQRAKEIHAMIRYDFYKERGMNQAQVRVLPYDTVIWYLKNLYVRNIVGRIIAGERCVLWYLLENGRDSQD